MERKVAFEIKRLDNLINRKILKYLKKENIKNISHVQAEILRYLYVNRDNTVYQSDIEKEADIRRSTVSGIFKTMEKNGYIIWIDSKKYTRKKDVSLSIFSVIRLNEMNIKVKKFEKELLNGISLEEKKVFFKVIDKLADNLK